MREAPVPGAEFGDPLRSPGKLPCIAEYRVVFADRVCQVLRDQSSATKQLDRIAYRWLDGATSDSRPVLLHRVFPQHSDKKLVSTQLAETDFRFRSHRRAGHRRSFAPVEIGL